MARKGLNEDIFENIKKIFDKKPSSYKMETKKEIIPCRWMSKKPIPWAWMKGP